MLNYQKLISQPTATIAKLMVSSPGSSPRDKDRGNRDRDLETFSQAIDNFGMVQKQPILGNKTARI